MTTGFGHTQPWATAPRARHPRLRAPPTHVTDHAVVSQVPVAAITCTSVDRFAQSCSISAVYPAIGVGSSPIAVVLSRLRCRTRHRRGPPAPVITQGGEPAAAV